jgi:hypothetical protein
LKGEAQPPGVVASQARAVAILCMVVTFGSGIWTASDFLRFSSGLPPAAELPRGTPQAEWIAQLGELMTKAAEPDRELLRAVLLILAVSLSFTFVCALRVLRPGGLPREGVRKLLSASALVTAVLRTVEGAAQAALSLRVARGLAALSTPPGWDERAFATAKPYLGQVVVGWSVFQTLMVAGSLLLVAQYFRSARVRAWAAVQDQAPR